MLKFNRIVILTLLISFLSFFFVVSDAEAKKKLTTQDAWKTIKKIPAVKSFVKNYPSKQAKVFTKNQQKVKEILGVRYINKVKSVGIIELTSIPTPKEPVYIFHIYEIVSYPTDNTTPSHTATVGWYSVNVLTGEIQDTILGKRIYVP